MSDGTEGLPTSRTGLRQRPPRVVGGPKDLTLFTTRTRRTDLSRSPVGARPRPGTGPS